MKFATKEDIEAPVGDVFRMLSEFELFERAAIRRGADVTRIDEHDVPHEGQAWEARFALRGKERTSRIELTRYEPPHEMVFDGQSGGLNTRFQLDLVALSPQRTRISVTCNVTPSTLPARLVVQSMKLAKSNLTKRFRLRVADFAKDIEDRHRRGA